jgi:F420-non-reducing hydrogenase iron-sulfur subunit
MAEFEPKVVCFSCNFGWGYLGDKDELAKSIKNWVPEICSGKVDTKHIFNAFRAGADGVLILGCPEGHCHFQDGNYQTRKKIYLMQKVMQAFGIEPERLSMKMSRDPEGKNIPLLVQEMKDHLVKLGPIKKM